MSTKVFVLAEVCLPRRSHAQTLSPLCPPLHEIFAFLSNIRTRLACMRTSRKTDFRSSKNNFREHDISQGLDREPPSLSPHFLLTVLLLSYLFYFVARWPRRPRGTRRPRRPKQTNSQTNIKTINKAKTYNNSYKYVKMKKKNTLLTAFWAFCYRTKFHPY